MGRTRVAPWVAGTVVLVLGIFAATWFLAASPRFDDVTALNEQTDAADAQNVLLRQQNAQLKEDFARLDEYKAELASMQNQIPPVARLAEYTRTLDTIAAANGVTIVSVAPGVPQTVEIVAATDPNAAAAAAGTAATDAATTAGSTDATTNPDATADDPVAATAPAAVPQIEGFVAVPVVIDVLGSYDKVSAFLEQLQTGTDRLFLPVLLDGKRQDQQDAGGGKPETAPGDLDLTITGFIYVLEPPATATAPAAEDPGTAAPALPASPRNPFQPLPGTEG